MTELSKRHAAEQNTYTPFVQHHVLIGQRSVDIKPVSKTELQRKLALRQGLLDFHQTALSEVVTEVGRHTGIEIDIGDEVLGSREKDPKF